MWDASGFDTHTVTPVTGESAVTVSVALDRSSARLKEGIHPACESVYLEADGTAAIETADGTFVASGEITVTYETKHGVSGFTFGSSLASHEGGFTVALSENETGGLGFSVDGSMESCVGEVSLWIEESMANGVSSGVGGAIGGWSNTGCPLDAATLDISAAGEGERSREPGRLTPLGSPRPCRPLCPLKLDPRPVIVVVIVIVIEKTRSPRITNTMTITTTITMTSTSTIHHGIDDQARAGPARGAV